MYSNPSSRQTDRDNSRKSNRTPAEPVKRVHQPEDLSRLSESSKLGDALKARLYSQTKATSNRIQLANHAGTKRKLTSQQQNQQQPASKKTKVRQIDSDIEKY
jgi:hypothetical protein